MFEKSFFQNLGYFGIKHPWGNFWIEFHPVLIRANPIASFRSSQIENFFGIHPDLKYWIEQNGKLFSDWRGMKFCPQLTFK